MTESTLFLIISLFRFSVFMVQLWQVVSVQKHIHFL